MSEITGTPSEGHPFPLNGSQNGDEYGRVPTSVIGVPPGAPVIVQAAGAFTIGQGMFGPPGVAGEAYGRWNVVPAGVRKKERVHAQTNASLTLGLNKL